MKINVCSSSHPDYTIRLWQLEWSKIPRDPILKPSGNQAFSALSRPGAWCHCYLCPGPYCPLERQSHASLSLFSKTRFQLPCYIFLVLIPTFPLVLTMSFHWPRNPSATQRHSSGGSFHAISPLMVPLQATSDMDYELSVCVCGNAHATEGGQVTSALCLGKNQELLMEPELGPDPVRLWKQSVSWESISSLWVSAQQQIN